MYAIDKIFKSGFDLVATIFDGGATNRKCIRVLVDSTTNKEMSMKLPSSFTFNNNRIFIMF